MAGARANCGIKAGRYAFEVKILEHLDPEQSQQQRGRAPLPRQLVRIGLSTGDASLILGDSEDSVCFDSEGRFVANRISSSASSKFARENVLALVVNMDQGENANTLSLFCDGKRISKPQPLPEALRGKTLFPAVCFRNASVQVNFGPMQDLPLPFKCRMLGDAAQADVMYVDKAKPKGPCVVLFPVCIPDEGTFDWLDMFLEQNPSYTELSDRKIGEWVEKSGIWRQRSGKTSNDKPEMNFGISQIDDFTVKRMLKNIAAAQKRNFVVMEVKGNLIPAERKELLKPFTSPHFKKVAKVLMGNPAADFKKQVHNLLRLEKQAKSDSDFKAKKAEEARKKIEEKKAKELAREERRKELAAKKAEKEAARAAAVAAGEEVPAESEAPEEEEAKDEDVDDKMEVDEQPPQVELTEEEKKQSFRKLPVPDLVPAVLSSNVGKFDLPDKAEGFDDVAFGWLASTKSAEHLKNWKQTMKLMTKVEEIQPGEAFGKQNNSWQSQLQKWRQKHHEWKAAVSKAEVEKEKAMETGAAKEGESNEAKDKDEPMVEEDLSELDVFGVVDVCDIGKGEPLYGNFGFEDWALLTLRVEMHLLLHAFKPDVKDPERVGIYVDNLLFYYNRYFRKTINLKGFGVENIQELLGFVKDTVLLNDQSVLEAQLSEELDNFDLFLKLTEDARRERCLSLDSGDSSVALNFNQSLLGSSSGPSSHGAQKGGSYHQKGGPYAPGGPPMPAPSGYGPDRYGGKGFGGDKGGFDKGGQKGGYGGWGEQKGGFKGFKGDKGWSDKGFGKGNKSYDKGGYGGKGH